MKDFNLLLVDNPVGTGYSYVDSFSYLTTDNTQIGKIRIDFLTVKKIFYKLTLNSFYTAKDLLEVVRSVYETLPQFKSTPLYVYGQSYGVKMAIEFAEYIYKVLIYGQYDKNISKKRF